VKRSTRLFIALALTTLLVAVSTSVWARGRKGTVPVPPRTYPGRCGDWINFDLGAAYGHGAECRLNVKLIKNPTKFFAPPIMGLNYLFDYAVEVKLVKGTVDQVTICVPLIPDWEDKEIGADKEINWYRWDKNANPAAWEPIPTVIYDPNQNPGAWTWTPTPPPMQPMICGTFDQGIIGREETFSLQGK